jgi:hypothetical protein
MDTTEFDRRLRELEAMIGQDVTMELFNEGYESLLNDVKVSPGARFEKLQRMAKVLARQTEYMMNLYLKEKSKKEEDETDEIVQ